MSQIWTIDTNKLSVLSTSSLAETEATGVFAYITTTETFAFTKIRKQTSDTNNLDLFVYDAWVQIPLVNIAARGGTFSFASTMIGETTRTWLKLFADYTSQTLITDLSGYTWVGDTVQNIPEDESGYFYVISGKARGENINSIKFLHKQNENPTISCIGSETFNLVLYNNGWTGDRNVYFEGGTFIRDRNLIDLVFQNGDLLSPTDMIHVDLSTLRLPSGRHVIQMRLSDDGETHANSDLSAANVYYDVPFNITFNLTNVTQISGGTTINPDATATYVFAPATGYALPDSVTVTGATSTWDQATGTLTLTKGVDTDPVEVTIAAIFMPKLNACSAEFDPNDISIVIITPDDGNGSATHFAMYDNSVATGVVIPRQT